jgi:hypothetical protein
LAAQVQNARPGVSRLRTALDLELLDLDVWHLWDVGGRQACGPVASITRAASLSGGILVGGLRRVQQLHPAMLDGCLTRAGCNNLLGGAGGRVNCPFYFKVGACRHGDRCSRQHNKPLFSQTVLLAHMYQAPNSMMAQQGPTSLATAADDTTAQEHFDDFYEEVRLLFVGRACSAPHCRGLGLRYGVLG